MEIPYRIVSTIRLWNVGKENNYVMYWILNSRISSLIWAAIFWLDSIPRSYCVCSCVWVYMYNACVFLHEFSFYTHWFIRFACAINEWHRKLLQFFMTLYIYFAFATLPSINLAFGFENMLELSNGIYNAGHTVYIHMVYTVLFKVFSLFVFFK